MSSPYRSTRHGPEWHIQQELTEFLTIRGWDVERMIGNAFQIGIPDLNVCHPKWGERWIDVKSPNHYTFTRGQRIKWPRWERFGRKIWILTAATQAEYDKLFAPPNWREYWKSSWELPDIDQLLSEI